MRHPHIVKRAGQGGFTLIELMVGLGLGLLTVAIIAQVALMAEGQKRTTTNGADAQISGALSLYAVQREVQMAGYGISASPATMGCTVKYVSGAITGNFNLSPVVIDDDGNGSDMITAVRSGKATFATPIRLTAPHAQAATAFTVKSSIGVAKGDLLIAVPYDMTNSWCTVLQVTDDATQRLTSTVIPHAAAASAPWNPTTPGDQMPPTGYPANINSAETSSYLVNVGTMVMNRFSINHTTNSLQVSSMSRAAPTWSTPIDVQPQIVVMKALYGWDTNGDEIIDRYDRVTPTTNADWVKVRSIRVLIVARSSQFEKDAVNAKDIDANGNLSWDVGSTLVPVTGATPCHTNSQCLSVPLTGVGTDWQNYRYKVYDTVIPLRNVLWKL